MNDHVENINGTCKNSSAVSGTVKSPGLSTTQPWAGLRDGGLERGAESCPPETWVLLAGLSLEAWLGRGSPELHAHPGATLSSAAAFPWGGHPCRKEPVGSCCAHPRWGHSGRGRAGPGLEWGGCPPAGAGLTPCPCGASCLPGAEAGPHEVSLCPLLAGWVSLGVSILFSCRVWASAWCCPSPCSSQGSVQA